MPRRVPGWVPWALLALVVAVVAFGVWSAYQAYQVNEDLGEATDDVTALRAAVAAGDQAAVQQHLADLQDHSGAAADRTSGFGWGVLTHVPGFGDDARGVRLVSDVVHDLSTDGLAPALRASRDLDRLLPQDGGVDLDALDRLRGPVATAAEALDDADQRLAAEDSSGYVDRLRTKYEDLQDQVAGADAALGSARTALRVLPTLLGADEPQQVLLVFQNNAEVRATGGLPGAVTEVQADEGSLEITRQAPGGSMVTDAPVLPLTADEQRIYGDVLGTTFVNANSTPDFPRAAALMAAHWDQEFPEAGGSDGIDAVVSLDAVTLSYVLAATGPIEVDGVSLSADNVVTELLSTTYTRLPDPQAQDAFFADVAGAAFGRFTTGGVADPSALLQALARGVDEGRVQVHASDDDVQGALAGTAIADELVTDPAAPPQLAVTLDDATGGKMSYYLRASLDVDSAFCSGNALQGTLTLTSDAPKDAGSLPDYVTGGDAFGTPPGDQLVLVRLYGPAGGTFDSLVIDDRKQPLVDDAQDGRSVQSPVIALRPGQSTELTFSVSTGADASAGDAQVTMTPTVEPGSPVTVRSSDC